TVMKQRFRLYRRSSTRRFYIQDSVTGKQETLGTADRVEALRLLHSKNEADRQPAINLQIARAYLAAGDPDIMTCTWQVVMDEHQAVVAAEINPERKAFFELAWHVGAAQIDLVSLKTEDVDWQNRLISYKRRKTGTPAILRFDEEVASILKRLPQTGSLFPNW